MKPMLSKIMPEHTTPQVYLNNPAWTIEQKLDGERLLIEVQDREATGYNRNGEQVKIPDNIAANFDQKAFVGKWSFDGEILGSTYFAFDCMDAVGEITSDTRHHERFDFLSDLIDRWKPVNIALVPNAEGTDKAPFFHACESSSVEGVIFKMKIGKYRPGKRSIETLKCKFDTEADVIVTEINRGNTDRGVSIGLYQDGVRIDAGGCKIPDEMIGAIKIGDVIQVKYLYASADNKLVQPRWVKPRPDKYALDCSTDQLKYTCKEPVRP